MIWELIHFALICAACFALMIVMTAGVFADETYLDENGDTQSVSGCNSFSQKFGKPGINYNTIDDVAVLSGSENGGTVIGDSGYAPYADLYGAGIGYGASSHGEMTIALNGGKVKATSNNKKETISSAQFIGRGHGSEDAKVTMSDTMRVLTDSAAAA